MKIVVAVDNTGASTAAVKHAVARANLLDAEVVFVNCVSSNPTVEGDVIREADYESAHERGETALDSATTIADEAGVKSSVKSVTHDTVVDGLLAALEDEDPHFVFVGHRQITHNGVGSVAKKLISRSPVPVTVVTEGQESHLNEVEKVIESA